MESIINLPSLLQARLDPITIGASKGCSLFSFAESFGPNVKVHTLIFLHLKYRSKNISNMLPFKESISVILVKIVNFKKQEVSWSTRAS